MKSKLTPIHGLLILGAVLGLVYGVNFLVEGGLERSSYTRVKPDQEGLVRLDVGDLEPNDVRFYRFLNYGNQEVKFFLARAGDGEIHAAFDANQVCYKLKRGYRHEGEWVVCNKCDKAFRIREVNDGGGGCKPAVLAHRLEGDQVVMTEAEILAGWRYFR